MNLRTSLTVTGAIVSAGALFAPVVSAAPDSGAAPSQSDPVVQYVMERDGKNEAQAKAYVGKKQDQQKAMRGLEKKGVTVDGAWFKGTELVVAVDKKDAAKARAAGLEANTAISQSGLDAIVTKVMGSADAKDHVISAVSNLPAGSVDVTVAEDTPQSVIQQLEAMDKVSVSIGTPLQTTADVYPGRIMDLVPGTNCSLGYPGKTSAGDNVLLTAGHCIQGNPDVHDANGTHIGKGVHTRFKAGSPSVDMGLMDIDAEDTGQPYVDTRGYSGYFAVKGISKNPIGSEICKSGNTTGTTCGSVQAYNVSVRYIDGTSVSGLAQASVCTEPGDSGGAYIGAGNLAQGMTSGGPIGVECGYNQGHNAGSYSYYQPAVDAANYYGVTIDTAN